jgi:signal transduction histidine kinase
MSSGTTPNIERSILMAAARGTAALTAVVAVAAVGTSLVFDARFTAAGRSDLRQVSGTGFVFIAALGVSMVIGSTLLVRRPEHPVGWCFALLSVSISLAAASQSYALYGLQARPGSLPGATSAAVVASTVFILWLIAIALVCSLTPDGHHLSPRWRLASVVMVSTGVLWFVVAVVSPGPLASPFRAAENPWAIPGVRLDGLRTVVSTLNNVLVLVAGASVVVRFRRSSGDQRRQLMWMAVVAVPFPALVVVAFIAAKTGNDALVNAAAAGFVVLLPVGAGLAVSRYHLYDVDRILSRAVSYLLVSSLMAGMYGVVVLLLARAIGQAASRSPSAIVVATLLVVAAARPVHAAVQDHVDRRFSRRRHDALRQVRAFVADPAAHRSVEAVLQTALNDPSLRVAYRVEEREGWVTEDGHPTNIGADALEVIRGGRRVAIVSHNTDQHTARAVVDEAAPELDNAGLRAAIALQLDEVRASRTRIAQAQVEERRRIERDLHDGAQQRLLGTAAQLQAALLNGDPMRLRSALELGVAECRHAVVELRELANGLHPAVLTEGGLTAALEDLSIRLPVTAEVQQPEHRYSADVEATMWFVVCEAVTNAIKHAQSATVHICLAENEQTLQLAVVDHGIGGADPTGPGLRGLADRVEAIGGRLAVDSTAARGTTVEAVIPCAS